MADVMTQVKDVMQNFLDKVTEIAEKIIEYFSSLDLYQIIAWVAIAIGLIMVIVSIFIW